MAWSHTGDWIGGKCPCHMSLSLMNVCPLSMLGNVYVACHYDYKLYVVSFNENGSRIVVTIRPQKGRIDFKGLDPLYLEHIGKV